MTRCLACPALRLWDPGDSGGWGVKVYAMAPGGRGSGEGLQALPSGTALTWSPRSVPSSLAAGWAQEGLRGSPTFQLQE